MTAESSGDREPLRKVSKQVFGQEHLLSIAVALLREAAPVTQADLVKAIGVNNASSLRPSLRRLLEGGFIDADPTPAPDGSRTYRPCPSAFWALVEELYQRAWSDGAMI